MKPNRIPLKQWLYEESERCGVTPHSVFCRLQRGKYQRVKLHRVNARVVFVEVLQGALGSGV